MHEPQQPCVLVLPAPAYMARQNSNSQVLPQTGCSTSKSCATFYGVQVAELSYWKQQAVARYDGLERDNQGLRKRVAELLRLGEKRSKSGEAWPAPHFKRLADVKLITAATDAHNKAEAAASLVEECATFQCPMHSLVVLHS
jgi:hypothetical protein